MDAILVWNQVALDVTREDFNFLTPDGKFDRRPEQPGPTRTSRALAIVHLAMFDAYNAADSTPGTYLTYVAPPALSVDAKRAAAGVAAAETLSVLFPRQKAQILVRLQDFLAPLGGTVEVGVEWGRRVAQAHLHSRENDGAREPSEAYSPSAAAYRHRVDPLNPNQGFLDPHWGQVKPFGVTNLVTVIPVTPPPISSTAADQAHYKKDYHEVFAKGRDQNSTRTAAETAIGLFWAYDGAHNIGVPPRLYNQCVRAMALKKGATEAENAKLFAAINVAMADAGIQAWYEKYLYNVWRPVVGIREADSGWGPTGIGDQNAGTTGDPGWSPLGSPRTNQPGLGSFTPGFPAYPSGHATFGAAALTTAQRLLNVDDAFQFELVSEEFNGSNVDSSRGVRPRQLRILTVPKAISENLLSRVYLGVHWRFDGDEGTKNGAAIAARVASAFPKLG